MSSAEEQVVLQALEAWAGPGPDALLAFFAEDAVYDNVPDKRPMKGREAIGAWLTEVFKHCYVEAEILQIAASGEWVLNERIDVHVVGDKRLALPVMNASRVVNGKIVEWKDYYCRKTCEELGLVPEA